MTESIAPTPVFRFMNVPRDKLFVCRRCHKDFLPPLWFFEGLCDSCFQLFDEAKMKGRFGLGPRCENSDIWIKENPV